jgi:hypothetical protein
MIAGSFLRLGTHGTAEAATEAATEAAEQQQHHEINSLLLPSLFGVCPNGIELLQIASFTHIVTDLTVAFW